MNLSTHSNASHQDYFLDTCRVTLQEDNLWKKFHELQTEMIVTKSGRRMFPSIKVQVLGLDPKAHYSVTLEFNSTYNCRYKYSKGSSWAPAGSEEDHSPLRHYIHPESPATGEHWMSRNISFGRVKLTNTLSAPSGHVVLSSMHKYQPRIIIAKTSDNMAIPWSPSISLVFPETQFIAVTAYQNEAITQLKIDNNPFAKGFRENGQSKCKRKHRETLEENNEQKVNDNKSYTDTESSDCVSTPASSPSTTEKLSPALAHEVPEPRVFQGAYGSYPQLYPYYYAPYSYAQAGYDRSRSYPYSYFGGYYPHDPLAWNRFLYPFAPAYLQSRPVTHRKLTDFSIKNLINAD